MILICIDPQVHSHPPSMRAPRRRPRPPLAFASAGERAYGISVQKITPTTVMLGFAQLAGDFQEKGRIATNTPIARTPASIPPAAANATTSPANSATSTPRGARGDVNTVRTAVLTAGENACTIAFAAVCLG